MPKIKDRENLKSSKRKTVTYKGAPIKLSADFSKETLLDRRDWQEIFKVMKCKDLQQRLFYPAKLSLRNEGQIKSFPTRKSKGVHHHTVLYEKLKGLL